LTPELLAASGARYSRNNEGLEAILRKIDPANLDRSVETIFRMIDYGHQSIADMVPVAMFIDGISIWLAYNVWTLCPTAGGQESSTRYLKLSPEALIPPEQLGIPRPLVKQWTQSMRAAFNAYGLALAVWEETALQDPRVTRIPTGLLCDSSESSQKKVARMRRNYAFDRARYFLPLAATTNMMLVMSARGWVQLCQNLLSYPLPEANLLGQAVRDELSLCAPRLTRHAEAKPSIVSGIKSELEGLRSLAAANPPERLVGDDMSPVKPPRATLSVFAPDTAGEADMNSDLLFHDNRYAWVGGTLRRTAVRFGWEAVSFAEIRDLNRHRTGSKFCPLTPQGFYCAHDQAPHPGVLHGLEPLSEVGRAASLEAYNQLLAGNWSYLYWAVLGTQFPFEHTTTADKFIYEAELRTGQGAHFRYAKHLHDALELWYRLYPRTRGMILEGSAEPE
jgi:thymidylate synthase ThyX